LAALTSASIPPSAAAESAVVHLALALVPDELLPLLPHPAASKAPLSAIAATANVFLFHTITLRPA
jgi:hypothetical protein